MSLQEEKKLVKEKEDLVRSLPFALPIKEIQNKINELSVLRKEYKVVLDGVFARFSAVREEVNGLAVGLDEIKLANTQDKEKNDPIFVEMKAEYD